MTDANQLALAKPREHSASAARRGLLHVMDAEYRGEDGLTFDQLFDSSKYDTLCAITYSSSFDTVYRLAEKFGHVEIVFGCPEILNGKISMVIASARVTIRLFKSNKHFQELLNMVKSGRITLYLLKGRVAHEKLYCLSGSGGTCVITGSANMSAQGLGGAQQEGITRFVDDRQAFDAYYKDFARAKEDASTKLDVTKLNVKDRDSASSEEALGMVENTSYVAVPVTDPHKSGKTAEAGDDFDFIQQVKNMQQDETIELDRKVKPHVVGTEKHYNLDALRRAQIDLAVQQEDREKANREYIHFTVDQNGNATFQGNNFVRYVEDTFPGASVESDLQHLDEYMESFSKFIPDHGRGMSEVVWKLLVYSFASPFLCTLRRASYLNGYGFMPFPMYAIVCGASDSSKTAMTRVISHLMSGGEPVETDDDAFTQTVLLKSLKARQTGLPIFINDVSAAHWLQQAGKILKQDNYEIRNRNVNDPLTILTSNDVKSLKAEESKRCILLRTTSFLTKTQAIKDNKWMSDLLASLSPHLYIEYLKRMSGQVRLMIQKMKNGGTNYEPDIALVSSTVIRSICQSGLGMVFNFMKPVSIETDYLGDQGVGLSRTRALETYYATSPEQFEFKRNGRVIIHFEHDYEAQHYQNELPRTICETSSGRTIICYEDALKKIGIRKKHWYEKL